MNSNNSTAASEEKFSTMKEWRERFFPREENNDKDLSKVRDYPWSEPLRNLRTSIVRSDSAD